METIRTTLHVDGVSREATMLFLGMQLAQRRRPATEVSRETSPGEGP